MIGKILRNHTIAIIKFNLVSFEGTEFNIKIWLGSILLERYKAVQKVWF